MNEKEYKLCKVFEEMCVRMEEFEFRQEFPNEAFTSKCNFHYSFGHTSLGTYIYVTEVNSGKCINLTDYDSW